MPSKKLGKRQIRRLIRIQALKTIADLQKRSGENSKDKFVNTKDSIVSQKPLVVSMATNTHEKSTIDAVNCGINLIEYNIDVNNKNNSINTSAVATNANFKNKLVTWACQNNITHKALGELLLLIRPKYQFLPVNARTLLKTPRNTNIIKLRNGEMTYLGIERALQNNILRSGLKSSVTNNTVQIVVNIDGIALYNNSSVECWPILIRCNTFNNDKPVVVAIYTGRGKPDPLEVYLENFINESKMLYEEGIRFENTLFNFSIKYFACDAPARAYLKKIKGHTSKNGCERCKIQGLYSDRRVCFPINTSTDNRQDTDFFSINSSEEHIKGKSPLLKLNIGLMSQFILDPMHLIYLGVMRRLLCCWVEGDRGVRFSKKNIFDLNLKIQKLRNCMPSDFSRKLRNLDEVKRWKATEFRIFLLYIGVILLGDILNSSLYKHFKLLHVAIFILSNKNLIETHLSIAEKLLNSFVSQSSVLYGKKFITYNVHSLIHICQDVNLYGPLESYSCFCFENYLGKIKNLVRGNRCPLAQISNRLTEIENSNSCCDNNRIIKPVEISLSSKTFYCKKLLTPNFIISVSEPDNFVSINNKIFKINSIFFSEGEYKCIMTPFRYTHNLFIYPVNSSELGIYYVKSYFPSVVAHLADISVKCVAFPFKDGYAIFPELHLK